MAVTRRTFETVANIIKNERAIANKSGSTDALLMNTAIALGLAAHFTTENPRFDRAKFLEACGLSPRL